MKVFYILTSSIYSQQHGGILQRSLSRPRSSGLLLQPPCTATQYWFFPVIKLVYDIEVNPGPNKRSKESPSSSKNNNIKIVHLKVRSLKNRGHFVQVKDTITLINFNVFTISETWLDHAVSNLEIKTPGYDIYRINRQNKTGGGVCIYEQQIFKTAALNEISGMSDNGFHQLWVRIQVRNLKSFLVLIWTVLCYSLN